MPQSNGRKVEGGNLSVPRPNLLQIRMTTYFVEALKKKSEKSDFAKWSDEMKSLTRPRMIFCSKWWNERVEWYAVAKRSGKELVVKDSGVVSRKNRK